MSILVQYRKSGLKNVAITLRKRGLSYAEIKERVSVSKGTLSNWLSGVELTDIQAKKLSDRRSQAARDATRTRKQNAQQAVEKIRTASIKDIHKVSKRELWLMGLMLYWREGFLKKIDHSGRTRDDGDAAEVAVKRGVRFSSSDPHLINFFLKWLQDVGGLRDEEIMLDLFLRADMAASMLSAKDPAKSSIRSSTNNVNEAIAYWSKATGFLEPCFSRIYIQKGIQKSPFLSVHNNIGKNTGKKVVNRSEHSPHGFLRIRVKASSMLARQIAGWIAAVQNHFDL